jgi:hypothetical protein
VDYECDYVLDRKETFVVKLKVLFEKFSSETEENHDEISN